MVDRFATAGGREFGELWILNLVLCRESVFALVGKGRWINGFPVSSCRRCVWIDDDLIFAIIALVMGKSVVPERRQTMLPN